MDVNQMIECQCGCNLLDIGPHKLTCTACGAVYTNVRFENPVGSGNMVFYWKEYCSKCTSFDVLTQKEKDAFFEKAKNLGPNDVVGISICVTMDYDSKEQVFVCSNCGCKEQRKFITNREA